MLGEWEQKKLVLKVEIWELSENRWYFLKSLKTWWDHLGIRKEKFNALALDAFKIIIQKEVMQQKSDTEE